MTEKKYNPWAWQVKFGLALLFAGILILVVIYPSFKTSPGPTIFAGLVSFVGILLLQKALNRKHGKKVENKAFSSLKLPVGWIAEQSVLVPGLGDVDLLITSPKGKVFAVEVKSNRDVVLKQSFFGEKLTTKNGKKLDCDPVSQIQRLVKKLDGAIPVIYFPDAFEKKRAKLKGGILYASGSRKNLLIQIGAKNWWSLW